MFYLNMRYLIVVSFLDNILLLEGLKIMNVNRFTSQGSIYLKSARRENGFDYSFKDWEETTIDPILDLNITTTTTTVTPDNETNKTTTKEETKATVVTTPHAENTTILPETTGTTAEEVRDDTVPTTGNVTLETLQEQRTVQDGNTTLENSTSTQETSTPTSTDPPQTALPTESTSEDMIELFASSGNVTHTTELPPPSTHNFEDLMPGFPVDIPSSIPFLTTTKEPILEEIKGVINKTNEYFTASLHELLLVLSRKNPTHVQALMLKMNEKIENLIALDAVAMFGELLVGVFQSVLQMLMLAPTDVMQEHLNYAVYALENRHTVFRKDLNTIFDVVDNIYIDKDVVAIAAVVKKIDNYPNISMNSFNLVSEVLNAFVFNVHTRIAGTSKEKILIMEINNILQNRLYPGENLVPGYGRRRKNGNAKGYLKSLRTFIEDDISLRITKPLKINTNRERNARKQLQYHSVTINIFTKKPRSKNVKRTNMNEVQNNVYRIDRDWIKRKIYDKKLIESKSNTVYSSHEPVSYTDSDENSSHESSNVNYSLDSRSTDESEKEDETKSNDRPIKRKKSKSGIDLRKNKYSTAKDQIKNEENSKRKTSILHKVFDRFKDIVSEQNDDENILKVNLRDALIHSGKNIKRRSAMKLNKIRIPDSFSDDEAVLKLNIYKAFGISDHFREQLRTAPGLLRRDAVRKETKI